MCNPTLPKIYAMEFYLDDNLRLLTEVGGGSTDNHLNKYILEIPDIFKIYKLKRNHSAMSYLV